MNKKGFLFALTLLFIILMSLSCSKSGGEKRAQRSKVQSIPVIVTTPRLGDIEKSLFLTAFVKGKREVTVYPDLPGKFQKFGVKQGEKVKKDTPILWLLRDIPGLNYPPVAVKAPVSGVVNLLPLEKGQYVVPKMPVATIFDTDTLKVIFRMPEKYAYTVKTGEWVKVKTVSGEWEKAKIFWMSSLLDPMSHTREVHAMMKSNEHTPLPGAITQVKVPVLKRSKVLVLPSNAILEEVLPYVFVVRSGVAHKKVVKLGISNLKETEIRDGLTQQDTVVIRGQNLLREGHTVTIEKSEGEEGE